MKVEGKKPALALVGPAKPKEDAEEYAGLDELCEVLGVAPDKRAAFRAAFETAVSNCK